MECMSDRLLMGKETDKTFRKIIRMGDGPER